MAKSRKKKAAAKPLSEKKTSKAGYPSKPVGFGYCSDCGSRGKIDGTCRICGVTDKGKK